MCQSANTFDSYVLAVTWQPGFCEHFKYNGRKPLGEYVRAHIGGTISTNELFEIVRKETGAPAKS